MFAALLQASLLAFTLTFSSPPPYGLPSGASLESDTTHQDGTRTIRYKRSDDSTVTIVIGLDGSTTETTRDKDGKQTVRQYETEFDPIARTRTETHDEGNGTTRRRTVDDQGRRRGSTTITETPREGDSTTVDREVRITEWDENGTVRKRTQIQEEEGLSPEAQRVVKRRREQTDEYDETGARTRRVTEEFGLKHYDEHGVPIPEGRRTTRTRNPQGGIDVTRERMNPETGEWEPEPSEGSEGADDPPPEPITEGPARRAIYVSLSPGLIHIALPNSVGYQWAARAGAEFPCGGPCAIATGLSFQHSVGGSNVHELRTQAELMPGARLLDDKLFVFGDVGIGHVANLVSFTLNGTTTRQTSHGVAASVGAGVSYAVWRELFVGGRFGGDLQWFFAGGSNFPAHNLALELMVGWRFGI